MSSLDSRSKLQIAVTNLPSGAVLAPVTSTTTLGPRAAANIIWKTVSGFYSLTLRATDTTTGTSVISKLWVTVGPNVTNISPVFGNLGVQTVAPGQTLIMPISASRPWAPTGSPNLLLSAGGLDGMQVAELNATPTSVSGVFSWLAPTAPGVYTLNLNVNDNVQNSGVYSVVRIPVIVGSSSLPMAFDQTSSQFTVVNQQNVIPVGVSSVDSKSKLLITSVSGLPGVSISPVTSTSALSARAAVNLTWTPASAGTYTALVHAVDKSSGLYATMQFKVQVENSQYPSNVSPSMAVVGVQSVGIGEVLTLPVSASRPWAPMGTEPMKMNVTGLPGVRVNEYNSTTTQAQGIITWNAPNQGGVYILNLEFSDNNGAYMLAQVPVVVGTSVMPIVFPVLQNVFVTPNTTAGISVSVGTLDHGSKMEITSVSGLPGASVKTMTSTVNLGQSASVFISWPSKGMSGVYNVVVHAVDKQTGRYVLGRFTVNVDNIIMNQSADLAIRLIIASVERNADLSLPFKATRNTGTGNLMMSFDGLPGANASNISATTTSISGMINWHAPANPGMYVLTVHIYDMYGAHTTRQLYVNVQ